MLNLLLEFAHESVVCGTDSVSLYFDHDLLGPICELEGADGLTHAICLGVAGCDETGLGVASKRVLQQPSQLGVPVRNVVLLLALS